MKSISYPTRIEQVQLGDKLFVLEVIRDLDEAIDIICDSMSEEEKLDPFAEDLCPYFGILWEASVGLSLYLHEHPFLVKGKRVLELGAGLGLPSLVATYLGGEVLATDFHPDVEVYFQRNARHSNLLCKYQRLNWREGRNELGLFDVVMGSDVLYESRHACEVAEGLLKFVKPQGKILLSDPGRTYLQKFVDAMKVLGKEPELASYRVKDKEIMVLEFTNE
jgi:predicted nicotinamide N-methyase